MAKAAVLGRDAEAWPYFELRVNEPPPRLVSVLVNAPEEHEYTLGCGFDLFLHEIDGKAIIFFRYGHFWAAESLIDRSTEWSAALAEWGIHFVGCPAEFSNLNR